ncbi:hypothetical protein [Methanobrevibacter sp.]|uniref:hypothetical protein n=1 Tax=Methanobrevibacter sp. TaxID=66852 RepID=UPI0026DFE482|nr:hypothetical protein [Methanobrevibacter sp.]MDO5860589.1 hypothetical protein [Methanobrevibacter sp.]
MGIKLEKTVNASQNFNNAKSENDFKIVKSADGGRDFNDAKSVSDFKTVKSAGGNADSNNSKLGADFNAEKTDMPMPDWGGDNNFPYDSKSKSSIIKIINSHGDMSILLIVIILAILAYGIYRFKNRIY